MMNPIASHTDRRAILALAAAVFAALGASCNIASPILYALEGPPTNPAVASLESDRTTVIFIDDRNSRLPKRSLRSDIVRIAEQALLDKDIIADGRMIAGSTAMRIAAGESDESPASIVDVGRQAGAEVIVYAEIQAFTISRDGVSLSPAAALEVKIFDTVANERLWPDSEAGYPLVVRLPEQQGQVFSMSLAERTTAERRLAEIIGLRIAHLFYETDRNSSIGS